MEFVLIAAVFGGKLIIGSRPTSRAGQAILHHRQRSMQFHHTTLTHSFTKVFAHSRCVHQRVPNSGGLCAAVTENDLSRSSWRKMLSARRV